LIDGTREQDVFSQFFPQFEAAFNLPSSLHKTPAEEDNSDPHDVMEDDS